MNKDKLYKNRSISACLKAAYDLWSTNIPTLLRRLWKPLLALSLCFAATTLAVYWDYKAFVTGQSWQVPAAGALVCLLLTLAAWAWYQGGIMALATPYSLKHCLKRSAASVAFMTGYAILTLLLVAAVSVAFFLLSYKKLTPEVEAGWNVTLEALVLALSLVLALPFTFSTMNYFNRQYSHFGNGFLKAWVKGLRHWGRLFSVVFFSGLIFLILAFVIGMPLCVIAQAGFLSANGMAGGDAPGLPGSFPLLLFLTAFVVSAILAVAFVWNVFTLHYAFGSIVTIDREKRALKRAKV